MKVGIGYCNRKDALLSGKEAAENALKKGMLTRADFIFAFCGGNVDHDEFFRGLQSVAGSDVPVIGGSAVGVITNDNLSYDGYPAAAAVIQSDTLTYKLAVAGDLNRGEKEAGRKCAAQLSHNNTSPPLVFYDSVRQPATATAPPVMNASAPLIDGIEEQFKSPIPILGAGLVGDYEFSPVKLFCGSSVSSQSVVGTRLTGDFSTYFRIMHGCTPLDGVYHTITKIDGSVIYEVDWKPIVEILDSIYGHQRWQNEHPVQLISIGVNYGERYGIPKEADYVNRIITGALPDGKSVGLFEPDLEEGAEFQFMLRDTGKMIRSARENAESLMQQIASERKKLAFGLYIDCAGRSAQVSNTETEEAAEVQNVFTCHETPLLGFYSGVEIAPFIGKNRGLDWTAVLIVFTEG